MVIKGQVEIPNETKTGFNVFHNETSADMVLFSGTDTWRHVEFGYNGAGKLYFFLSGTMKTISFTVSREPRRIILGGFLGYIDEFRILDGICEHTANFTVPSTAYKFSEYPNNTLSLMHFE